MATPTNQDKGNEKLWHQIFALGHPDLLSFQRLHSWLPSPPRCKMCLAPFRGVGGVYMRFRGKGPANRNPNYCSACDKFIRAYPGSAEVELTMIIADLTDSKKLASQMTDSEWRDVLNSFYGPAVNALIETDGFFVKFVGDEVDGVYPPGFSGKDHARKAIQAAEQMLRMEIPPAPNGSPVRVKVAVHTGVFCIGTVGWKDPQTGVESGPQDVQAMGDNVHITQLLSKAARPGEALITEAAYVAAGGHIPNLESRQIMVEGRREPITVRVMRAASS